MEVTYCELRDKEVINIFDGKKLGRIIDLTLDDNGVICKFSVPMDKSFFRNFSQDPIQIEWKKIVKIGVDTILVDLCE